jgi:beta-phosphoglucomutase family hydrolase
VTRRPAGVPGYRRTEGSVFSERFARVGRTADPPSDAARIVLDGVRRCGVLDAMTQRSADAGGAQGRPAAAPTSLGLPDNIRGLLFDLDGVLTRTSTVHAAAWKEMFDGYLRERSERTGEQFREFDASEDYAMYVDGKPRQEGTKSFLQSRDIDLPMGERDDPASQAGGSETIYGLGNRKNEIVHRRIRTDGVEVYDGSVRYLRAARDAGLRTAVVSSSANTRDILLATGLESLFEARVDAQVAVHEHLAGKPAPDTFLHGAAALEIPARDAVVFEDAVAGVEAGRAGGFGLVVGVDRLGQADRLRQHGADIVVSDLEDLLEKAP